MRKKAQTLPVPKVDAVQRKLYIVTDRIQGNIQHRYIEAVRGQKLYLSDDEARVFKDSILEI